MRIGDLDYSFTQPVCDDCWDADHPDHPSPRTNGGYGERCCKCGEPTTSGIYIRIDPSTVAHPTPER